MFSHVHTTAAFPNRCRAAVLAFFAAGALGCDGEPPSAPAVSDAPVAAVIAAAALTFTQISSGAYHTCGLVGDGKAYCWGMNRDGQLGDGTRTDRSQPRAVAGTLRFTQISA